MHDLLKSTSPGMRFLTAIFNLIVANILFLITSIPIVTIGTALPALYKITFEIVDGEEVFLLSDFYKTLFKNIKRGTLLWLPLLLLTVIMSASVFLIWAGLEGTAFWMMIPPMLFLFLGFCLGSYAFPLMALCDDPLKVIVKNAFLLALGHLPTTIFIFVLHAAVFGLLIVFDVGSVVLLSLMLFMGCAVVALICSFFLRRIFLPYIPKQEIEED